MTTVVERQPCRRRRPALSCIECRRRKIKCDRKVPCTHCVSALTRCIYKMNSARPVIQHQLQRGGSFPPVTSPTLHAPTSTAQIQEFGTIESSPGYVTHRSEVQPTAETVRDGNTPSTLGRSGHPPLTHDRDAEPNFSDLLRRIQKLEKSSVSSTIAALSDNGPDILALQPELQHAQIVLNKTRVLRWSHWAGAAQELALILACFTEATGHGQGALYQGTEIRALVLEMSELLQKCKRLARSIKMGRPSRSLSGTSFSLVPPARELADMMVNLYFRFFESTYRILHVPTFWNEYRKFWDQPESAPSDLRLKVLLVIGVGSSLYRDPGTHTRFRDMVHEWVYAAQTWLSGPIEKNRLEIAGLQVHCLTILARQIFSIGGDLVWMSMGSLMHSAMQMGLHRDPKHLPAMSVLQAETRRRLWATILELIVQSSLDSSMPPRISSDEFDTEAPSNINDNEIDESVTTVQPHPRSTYTSTSMQLILLDSIPTRLRILQLLNGLNSELSYLDVLGLSSGLTDICRACGNFVKENKDFGVTAFHRNMLDYLVRRFFIPLHCPFASQARTNPLFHYSLKVSVDTALAIITPEQDEGFSRLMAVGGGMFKEGIRYALAGIGIELISHVNSQRLDGTLHRKSQYKELLKQAIKDMITLSTERIRQGETNVKGHMFLCMIMAQAEATEEDASCDFRIAQSARDSLVFCHDLLRTRLDSFSPPLSTYIGSTPGRLDGTQANFGLDFDLDLDFFLPDIGLS